MKNFRDKFARFFKKAKTTAKAEKSKPTEKSKEYLEFSALFNEAKTGNSEAQYRVGRAYCLGIPKVLKFDEKLSFYWLYRAARNGNSKAQYAVALAYLYGYGVKIDEKLAFLWTEMAAENGDFVAEKHLSLMYQSGIGVEKSILLWQYFAERSTARIKRNEILFCKDPRKK